MKRNILIGIIVLLVANLQGQMKDTMSYSVGLILAENLKSQGMTQLDAESIAQAFKDHQAGDMKLSLTEAEQNFSKAMEEIQLKNNEVAIEGGANWLIENAKKEGVMSTESGLQYKVITEGDGAKPTIDDKVRVHYHGSLITGEVFDSSVERGEPISFPLNGVIQGWQEGLQLMTVGSKYMLYIPYPLGYGARGAGATIKPYSTLIFEVELLGIE